MYRGTGWCVVAYGGWWLIGSVCWLCLSVDMDGNAYVNDALIINRTCSVCSSSIFFFPLSLACVRAVGFTCVMGVGVGVCGCVYMI